MTNQALSEQEAALEEEYQRLRRENKQRFKRRIATVGVVLLVAAGIEWNRQIGIWLIGTWYGIKSGGNTTDVAGAFQAIQQRDAIVIDVRESLEYHTSHLRAALSLPLGRLESEGWPSDWPRDKRIITYCTVGYRSGLAAERLREAGMDAVSLKGGIIALCQARKPLYDDSGPTNCVHTWSESFAWMLPEEYEAVWSPQSTPGN